jgi:hypothetical protein
VRYDPPSPRESSVDPGSGWSSTLSLGRGCRRGASELRVALRLLPHQRECGAHAARSEQVEDLRCPGRVRAVVDRQRDGVLPPRSEHLAHRRRGRRTRRNRSRRRGRSVRGGSPGHHRPGGHTGGARGPPQHPPAGHRTVKSGQSSPSLSPSPDRARARSRFGLRSAASRRCDPQRRGAAVVAGLLQEAIAPGPGGHRSGGMGPGCSAPGTRSSRSATTTTRVPPGLKVAARQRCAGRGGEQLRVRHVRRPDPAIRTGCSWRCCSWSSTWCWRSSSGC